MENKPKFELVTVKSLEYYPIFKSRLENWEKLNPMLEIAIRECATNEDYKDNVRAPRTEWRMHSHKKYGKYFKYIGDKVCKDITEINALGGGDWKPYMNDCWGIIYGKGNFTREHKHWPSTWVFSYYVNVGENSPPILIGNEEHPIKPEDGLFVIFPGDLRHSVPKQEEEKERIVIAGNIHLHNMQTHDGYMKYMASLPRRKIKGKAKEGQTHHGGNITSEDK